MPLVSIDHSFPRNTVVAGVVRHSATSTISIARTAFAAGKSLHSASKSLFRAIHFISGYYAYRAHKSSSLPYAKCRACSARHGIVPFDLPHAVAIFSYSADTG